MSKKENTVSKSLCTVFSRDQWQEGYKYELTAPTGKDFHPDFKPQLRPQEMLELGIMDGVYFSVAALKEFPAEWYKHAKRSIDGVQHKELNFFNASASQSLKEWQKKGWIHKDDPRGWIQWYFRYFFGRRSDDDERQIKRWYAFRRHASQVRNNCKPKDYHCRPRQRQALLHWAYDSRIM